MTHGSLGTGMCGFDIGAEENGFKTIYTSEIDPLGNEIAEWLFPQAKRFGDMRDKNPKSWPYVDVISFGFPCQDISLANSERKGLQGPKSSLWWTGFEIIRFRRPRVVVIENSPNLIHSGFNDILAAFAKEGYNVEWDIISCKRFGLPHIRERLFVIAYTNRKRRKSGALLNQIHPAECHQQIGWQGQEQKAKHQIERGASYEDWLQVVSKLRSLDDGVPPKLFQGLLKLAGNSVSPLITSWIFSRIKQQLF